LAKKNTHKGRGKNLQKESRKKSRKTKQLERTTHVVANKAVSLKITPAFQIEMAASDNPRRKDARQGQVEGWIRNENVTR